MIDDATKQAFLAELEKNGNVYVACAKVGIGRATFYRWRRDDKKFKKLAFDAVRNGRSNVCDIAEHALMGKVREKDMGAIKYVLGHNSQRYKTKRQTHVFIDHHSDKLPKEREFTLVDFVKFADKIDKNRKEYDEKHKQNDQQN